MAAHAPAGTTERPPVLLATLALAGAAVAAALGLLVEDLYPAPESTRTMLRAYDGVTLALGVPLLAATLRARRLRGQLLRMGALAYLAYGYALAVFATGLHDGFLLHLLVLGTSSAALVSELAKGRAAEGVRRRGPAARTAPVAVLLALLALGLGGMWLVAAIGFALDGAVPAGSALVETERVVQTGIALDLLLLVPAYGLSALLLWQHRAWGYVVGAVVLVSGVLHQVGYLAALVVQRVADVPGSTALDPAELPIAALFLVGAVVLVHGARRGPPGRTWR